MVLILKLLAITHLGRRAMCGTLGASIEIFAVWIQHKSCRDISLCITLRYVLLTSDLIFFCLKLLYLSNSEVFIKIIIIKKRFQQCRLAVLCIRKLKTISTSRKQMCTSTSVPTSMLCSTLHMFEGGTEASVHA